MSLVMGQYTWCVDDRDDSECVYATLSDSYVLCLGYQSCYSASISTTSDTVCDGYQACAAATVEADDDVTCDGYMSCFDADITASDDCFCYGYLGCFSNTIVTGNEIYCDGIRGCYSSTLEAGTDVTCNGKYGCFNADITAEDSVYCNGEYGCYYSNIYAEYVYAYGEYSLHRSEIHSKDSTNLEVHIGGYNATVLTFIYCYSGSKCKVYCEGTGCYNVYLFCYDGASCRSYCDSDCDYCATTVSSYTIEEDNKFNQIHMEQTDLRKELTNSLNIEMNKIVSKDNIKHNKMIDTSQQSDAIMTKIENEIVSKYGISVPSSLNDMSQVNANNLSQNSFKQYFIDNFSSIVAMLSMFVIGAICMRFYGKYCNQDTKYNEYEINSE